MSSKHESEMFALAKGLPVSQLTSESRVNGRCMQDWHRITDEEFDRELDFWFNNELVQQPDLAEQSTYSSHQTTSSTARLVTMPDGDSSTTTDTAAVAPQTKTEESFQNSFLDATDSPLSQPSNDFENPDHHQQDEDDHHTATPQEGISDPFIEAKQEVVATALATPPMSGADEQNPHLNFDPFNGSHPLQRVSSEPSQCLYSPWQNGNADGSPIQRPTYHPTGTVHQPYPFATLPNKMYAPTQGFDTRARAQTFEYASTSHLRHNLHNRPESSLKNRVTAMDHFESGQMRLARALPDQSQSTMSNGLGHLVDGQTADYEAGSAVGTRNALLGFGTGSGVINTSTVNQQKFHHNNDGLLSVNPHIDPQDVHQGHGVAQYSNIPPEIILKSQRLPASSNIRNNVHLAKSQPRESLRSRPHQDHMAKHKGVSPASPPELHYNDIAAARQAERPRFKTNGKKDHTIPREDYEKQEYVARMVRCMKGCKFAEDNDGMINQWNKLKQDEPRMEQAAWRLLTQKTMCKHLLGAEFAASLVNDPTTATQRVQNNRKVNAGKKSYLDQGRRAVHGNASRSARRGSSTSTQLREENSDYDGHAYGDARNGVGPISPIGELGDEDAEGDIDEEFFNNMPGHTSVGHLNASSPGPAAVRRTKRELDRDDSDEYGHRAKKSRRTSAKNHPTAPKRHIKNPRPSGDRSRSKFQIIDGEMISLEDKKHEELVYSRGNAHIQELFTKIHYPHSQPPLRNGRYINGHASSATGYYPGAQPTSIGSSRRVSRAAAPTSFVGQDNSSEGDEPYSDDKNEGFEEYHLGADLQST
ncbi:MAG: hypothetical protein Q9213_005502 [Squamulea squamosa]